MVPVKDEEGNICDIRLDYAESYVHQMLRYGQEYGTM
jgi:dipeptidyl-peptidase-3